MTFHNRPRVESPRVAAIHLCKRITLLLSFVGTQIKDKTQAGYKSRSALRAALDVVSEYRAAIEIQDWEFFHRPKR